MNAVLGSGVFVAGIAVGSLVTALMTWPVSIYLPAAPSPNATDIGFSQDMSTHHTQALLMADILLERPGASAPVRALAAQIELGQAEEIGIFRGWLRLWNAPVVSAVPMSWMTISLCSVADREGKSSMPGLATQPELEELRNAQGTALDHLFLQLMLYHHIGGIGMIRAAIVGADVPQVRMLAREMLFEESEEIGYINQVREREDGSAGLSAGRR